MDAVASGDASPDENAYSVRRSRVVLAPRPWRYASGSFPPATGARKAASPGRARISRKTVARGKPGCLGCTCLTRVHSFASSRTRCCGRSQRPAFPAPSIRVRADEMAKLGRNRAARTRRCVSPSLRAKRSNPHRRAKEEWIASSRSLSSGARSRDPLAPRNCACSLIR
jgi:hypothetical protein